MSESKSRIILGIETSCDETGVALVADGRRLLAGRVASQTRIHAPYSGVVPELASREHVRALPLLVDQVLADAGLTLPEVDAIAVTQGPGLVGSLLVGVSTAKAFSFVLDRQTA